MVQHESNKPCLRKAVLRLQIWSPTNMHNETDHIPQVNLGLENRRHPIENHIQMYGQLELRQADPKQAG